MKELSDPEKHVLAFQAGAASRDAEIEYMRLQLTAAQDALENEQAKGIHSCHADCTMEGCVNRKLRQQLSAAQETVTRLEKVSIFKEECRQSIEQQLADSQKREVMLRHALRFYKSALTADDVAGVALAATADLKDVILCHAELCRNDGRCQYAIDHGAEGLGHCPDGKCCMPLYRAWEPK